MAAPDVTKVYRLDGRLAINCTDFSTAWPHGGTGLGTHARAHLIHGIGSLPVTGEEFGGQAVDHVLMHDSVILLAYIRGWDNDALSTFFQTTTGASTDEVITLHGTNRAGRLLGQDAVKVTFTARNQASEPSIHLYNAVPLLRPEERMNLTITRELSFLVAFSCMRDGSGNVGQMGKLSDLTV